MIRWDRAGVELLGGLELGWSTLGLGVLALLVVSPGFRRGARSLAVATIAGGMKVAQGVANFGGQIREEVGRGMQQPNGEPMQSPMADPVPAQDGLI